MEDRTHYGKTPKEPYTLYKFEVNPVNPEVSRVYAWKNLTSRAAYNIIPVNYKLCEEAVKCAGLSRYDKIVKMAMQKP